MDFSIDLISDLNLGKSDNFDWTGKQTSLFCVVAGNVSHDLSIVKQTLEHLSNLYRGVFYIDGAVEHSSLEDYEATIERLHEICKPINNVVYMHNHVVVLNNIAFVGINGWYKNNPNINGIEDHIRVDNYRNEDLGYLSTSIKNLQLHRDTSKIVVVSSCVPSEHFLYQQVPFDLTDSIEPCLALIMDIDHKVNDWLYGGTTILVDNVYNRRRYANNPKIKGQPYWPKRVIV